MDSPVSCCGSKSTCAAPIPLTEAIPDTGGTRTVLRIDGMNCPTEETMIRGKLNGFPGVTGLELRRQERRPLCESVMLMHDMQPLALICDH